MRFLEALAKDFEEGGEDAIKIMRIERPAEYVKVVASILPKEFEINDSRLQELSDDELDGLLTYVRWQLAGAARDAGGREETSVN
jgi:hypothetical protein